MTTIEMAKVAFASRRAVDAWFKDAAPNFEAFAEMVRKEEREACANILPNGLDISAADMPHTVWGKYRAAIMARSNDKA